MSFEFIRKLPTPAEIKEEYPLPAGLAQLKEKRDAGELYYAGAESEFLDEVRRAKDIPANVVAVGNPAKIIRQL